MGEETPLNRGEPMTYVLAIAAIGAFALWMRFAGGALLSYVTRNPSRRTRIVAGLWVTVVANAVIYMESLTWSSSGWPTVFLISLVLLAGLAGLTSHVHEKQLRTRR